MITLKNRKQLNQVAHKTTIQNRTQNVPVFPSDFTGKERDEETGYGYFGARYMDHEQMTMWLSVDPMANKYSNISPYAYCAWNPLKLVDPDGMEVYITGDAADQAVRQLSSKGIDVTRDEKTGRISYSKTGKSLSKSDKQLIAAIDSEDITVFVYATNAYTVPFEGGQIELERTGMFMGVSVSDCDATGDRTAETRQLVSPKICEERDREYNAPTGTSMRHEITESFHAGVICRNNGESCGPAWEKWNDIVINGIEKHVYWMAHKNATQEAKDYQKKYKKVMSREEISVPNGVEQARQMHFQSNF